MFINVGKQLIEQKLYTMADHQSQIEKKLQENESNNLEELYKKIRNKNKLINEKKIKRIYNQ